MYRFISLAGAVAAVLLAGLSRPLYAQHSPDAPPAVLELERLIHDVRTQNPSLRSVRTGAEALSTRPAQVTALPDPTVMAGYRPLGFDAFSDAVPNLRVQQAVPFPGKLALRGRAAEYEALAAAHQADAVAAELVLRTKQAYYELYLAQQRDLHVRRFQRALDGFEEIAAVKYEVGDGTQQAILKAQLERNALARERLRIAEERRTHVEALARLANRPDLILHAGDLVVAPPRVRVDTLQAAEVARTERPEVAALRAEMSLAETQVDLAKKEFLPDFMLEVGFMDMGGMNDLGHRFTIGGGLTIPLQTGRREAALEEAQLRRAQVEARQEALRTEIQTRINELNNRLREGARALALYDETLIPQAETTLEATVSAYTTGRAGFLDLLDAERMKFDLEVERDRTYARLLKSAAELEYVIGIDSLDDPQLAHSPSTR